MSKNIVYFSDGTWNGPGKDENNDGIPDPSNVFFLFDHLTGDDTPETKLLQGEQEKTAVDEAGVCVQVAKYLHGVGDSRNAIGKLLGGGFGAGVIKRIVRGYTFISRHYEPGDRIYIAGFSRGAYTARALGGMICTVGLLDPARFEGLEDHNEAYRAGVGAWARYRKAQKKGGSFVEYLIGISGRRLTDADMRADVDIEAIAVWDTVGALGIPAYAAGAEGRVDLYEFADRKLSTKVRQGYHAVSIHERRADFVPTLWDKAPNVRQVWFAGAHSDVGGGYPVRCLSDIALHWMADQLEASGLLIEPGLAEALKPDPKGKSHAPWEEDPWRFLPFAERTVPADAELHESVKLRSVA